MVQVSYILRYYLPDCKIGLCMKIKELHVHSSMCATILISSKISTTLNMLAFNFFNLQTWNRHPCLLFFYKGSHLKVVEFYIVTILIKMYAKYDKFFPQ